MEEKSGVFDPFGKVDGTSMGTEWDWSNTRGIRKKRKKETPVTDRRTGTIFCATSHTKGPR
jgi:hypothetical protein